MNPNKGGWMKKEEKLQGNFEIDSTHFMHEKIITSYPIHVIHNIQELEHYYFWRYS
jgi:hypothetical protein